MIAIISGTNRVNNKTRKVARHYHNRLNELGVASQCYSLEDLPADFLMASKHADFSRSPEFKRVQEELIFPAEKFIFIMPEYNGSIPGILKLFIDSSEVQRAYHGKKACLTGISSGRAGNLRGLDHLTNILNYLKMQVYHNKLPISRIDVELDANGQLQKEGTRQVIEAQLAGFVDF